MRIAPFVGAEIEIVGTVVSTKKVLLVAPVLPTASRTRTTNVYVPSGRLVVPEGKVPTELHAVVVAGRAGDVAL